MIAKRHTLANALRVAAEQYAADSVSSAVHPRIAESFKSQAAEAIALADAIEQADTIRLED